MVISACLKTGFIKVKLLFGLVGSYKVGMWMQKARCGRGFWRTIGVE